MKKNLLTIAIISLSLFTCGSAIAGGDIGGPVGMKPHASPNDLLGYVKANPYKNAPLTALVTLGGHEITNVHVSIKPKGDGVAINYDVTDMNVMSEGGVPIFGLYPHYLNEFTVSWTEKGENKHQDYKLLTPAVDLDSNPTRWADSPIVTVKHVDPKYKDRLYMLNWTANNTKNAFLAHNNPFAPGAFAWDGSPGYFIIDTHGDVRWYLNPYTTHDSSTWDGSGYAMGMHQLENGDLVWMQGQAYYRMSLTGRMIWKHMLPGDFIDGSHEAIPGSNGHYFLKVARKDYLDPDTKKLINTIRDQVIEVDESGELVDVWDMNKILDNKRDDVLKALDAGTVCLNIDAEKEGTKVSEDDLQNSVRGDALGVAAGRNWLHMNSVWYDGADDSIIISSRHQSTVAKIGRDKKVKWMITPTKGWKGDFLTKILKPIDTNGKPIKCDANGVCDDPVSNFDFPATQHTAYKSEKISKPGHLILTVFDNGDARHLTQPALASMKYSRGVVYDIDEKNMTIKQVWEYGKDELGNRGYSAVTGITKYEEDKNSIMSYFTTPYIFGVGGSFSNNPDNVHKDEHLGHVQSILTEFDYGSKKPAVEINIDSHQLFALPYRSLVIHPKFGNYK